MLEKEYDKIMTEGEKIYNRQNKMGDAYAFHKAFEKAQKELDATNGQAAIIKEAKELLEKAFIKEISGAKANLDLDRKIENFLSRLDV